MIKTRITEQILEQIPAELKLPINAALPIWWYNIRKDGGMRLTKAGYNMFKFLDIKSYKITYDPEKTSESRRLLELDKKLTLPYYIRGKTIYLYGEKEAALAVLYSDLEQFLKYYI